jgi:3-oxoacyl-[acyl-carrier-protein] synthase II
MCFVITGMGVLSPLGVGTERLIDGLLGGAVATRRDDTIVGALPPEDCRRVREQDIASALGDEATRNLSKEVKMLLGAARLAIADARLDLGDLRGEEIGIAVSTTCSGLQAYADLFRAGMTARPGAVDPARGPQTGFNAPAAYVSIRLALRGPNVTVVSGAVGGFEALAYALQTLSAGRAKVMLVGGVDTLLGALPTGVLASNAV